MRFLHDLRIAARTLRRAPVFTAAAVLTLALGVGINSGIFTVAAAYLLPKLPVPDAARVVIVESEPLASPGYISGVSYPDWQDWRGARAFEAAALFAWPSGRTLASPSGAARIGVSRVTERYFDVLHASPQIGRTLSPIDFAPGAAPAIVLSHRAWMRQFGGDRAVLGRSIRLDEDAFTVVGVLPEAQGFPLGVDGWTPLHAPVRADRRDRGGLFGIARLNPGAGVESARQELSAAAARLAEAYPETNRGMGLRVRTVRRWAVGEWITPIGVLVAIAALVLLIACANLATVLVARGVGRAREVAVRTALGASPRHIVRQLAAEYVLLASAAGSIALILAAWSSRALNALVPSSSAPSASGGTFAVDARVMLFTAAIALGSVVLFGLAPVVQAMRADVMQAMRRGAGSTPGPSGAFARAALVVAQFAMATVLLTGAGLLVTTMQRFDAIDLGFDRERLAWFWVNLPARRYADADRTRQFAGRALADLSRLPSAESVAMTSRMDVPRASDADWGFTTRWDLPARTTEASPVAVQAISPAYLSTMGIPLVSGRGFSGNDRRGSQRVAIVSENLARDFFAGRPAVGAEIRLGPGGTGEWATVVGVTRDVREPSWYELTIAPYWIYLPFDQHPAASLSFVARTRTAPEAAFDGFRSTIAALDPELPVEHMRTARTLVYAEGFSRRAMSTLASVFGGLGVVLAGVGLYGVVMWSVIWRRRELAIRTALGADARQIVWPIVRDGLRLGIIGSLIGIPAALVASGALAGMLDDVSPRDPSVMAAVVALLFVVVVAASYLPARSAARVDPAAALRAE